MGSKIRVSRKTIILHACLTVSGNDPQKIDIASPLQYMIKKWRQSPVSVLWDSHFGQPPGTAKKFDIAPPLPYMIKKKYAWRIWWGKRCSGILYY